MYLAISFICLFINFVIFVQGWRSITRKLGGIVSFRNAFWIMTSSQIAKYVPGGIWFVLGRVYLGKAEKIREEITALSVIIETGLTFMVGVLLFALSAIFVQEKISAQFLLAIPVFCLFLIMLYPPVINRFMNFILKILRRPAINLDVAYVQILQLSFFFIGLWVAQIIGFFFLVNAVYTIPFSKVFNLAAAYVVSWMIGFIVPFAPGGLGVREGMMTLLLQPLLPTPLAIAISFIARVWITLFEIVVFFVGLSIKKKTNKEKEQQSLTN